MSCPEILHIGCQRICEILHCVHALRKYFRVVREHSNVLLIANRSLNTLERNLKKIISHNMNSINFLIFGKSLSKLSLINKRIKLYVVEIALIEDTTDHFK